MKAIVFAAPLLYGMRAVLSTRQHRIRSLGSSRAAGCYRNECRCGAVELRQLELAGSFLTAAKQQLVENEERC